MRPWRMWKNFAGKHRFPGGVFWVNGESNENPENLQKSVVVIPTFVNISASVTDNIYRGHLEQIPVMVVPNETSMASFDRQCR